MKLYTNIEKRIRDNFVADMQKRYAPINDINKKLTKHFGDPIEAEMKYANPLGIKLEAA